ncbi:MAG: hypothetical protein KF756_07795 [Acidobacteria bacterium]|nr:hypothetical protein [Acidobacteriota bacterium]
MKATKAKTKTATQIIKLWQNKNNTAEVDYPAIIKWAIENNYYKAEPITPEQQLEADLRRAVKNAHWTNPKGKKVRTYGIPRIMFEGEMLTLSPVDMRVAKPDIAKVVQDANFNGIKNDVKRHSIETESYNDNNPYDAKLPLYDYDLNAVAEEARLSGEYDDSFDDEDLGFEDDDE